MMLNVTFELPSWRKDRRRETKEIIFYSTLSYLEEPGKERIP